MRRISCRDFVLLIGLCSILSHAAQAQPMPQPWDRGVVESMLSTAPTGNTDRPLNVVLLAGPKDHGLNEHDYPLWQRRWKVLLGGRQEGDEPVLNTYGAPLPVNETDLSGAKNVTVSTAWIKPTPQQWQTADLIVMNCAAQWDAEMLTSLQAFLERGGGFVVMHLAMWQESPALAEVIGAAKQPATEFRHGPVQLEIVAPDDAITTSLPPKIALVDESYFNFQGDLTRVHVLAVSHETRQGETQARPEPMFWTRQYGKGRIFVCVPGHYMWTFDDPVFRLLLLRGMAWAAGESPYRFDTLALRGARLAASAPATPVTAEEPRADDPDLLLWLSASDRPTLAVDDDQTVSSWKNKAARIGHAVTATGNARPRLLENALGAQPAIRFDGKDDVLSCTDFAQSTDRWTLLMVVVPQSNQGSGVPDGFRCFFSSNEHRQQDFVTGINVDMGATQTDRFWCLNVEGAAGAGATNLLFTATDFSQPRVLTITANNEQMNLLAESIPQGSRGAGDATTSLAEVRIGARYYFQNQATGFVHADMAEILLYRTCLPTDRLLALSKYLETKYGVQAAASKISQYTLEDAITGLAAYDWDQSRETLGPIDAVIRGSDQQEISRLEQQLVEAIETGAPPGATDFICRRLAVIGSSACVAPLARLLQDPERSGPALAALQRIPASEAGQQLVAQLQQTEGATQLGIMKAFGRRREVSAVDELLTILAGENAETVRAAAAALAEIAEPRTVPILSESCQHAPQMLLRLAERLAERHESELARSVYEQLATNQDNAVRAAVLHGLVSLEPHQSAPLVTAALRSGDARMIGQAAQLMAHYCAAPIVQQILTGFTDLPPLAQQTLLGMRWTRLPNIGHQLGRLGIAQADPDIVVSALQLLALYGVQEDVPQLSGLAANVTNEQIRRTAGLALQHLAAPGTDQAIVNCLLTAESQQRLTLIRALRDRRSRGAGPALLGLAAAHHGPIRLEALKALEIIGDISAIEPLIAVLLKSGDAAEQDAAERAIWLCAMHSADERARVQPLLQVYTKAVPAERVVLLPVLGRLGGSAVLPTVLEAQSEQDPALRDAAVRALANWPDASVADRLLDIARQADVPAHRIWSLRGYVRVVTLPGARAPEQTLQMLRPAWDLASRIDERKLILKRLTAVPCPDSLTFAIDQFAQPQLKQDAILTAAVLAETLLPSAPEFSRAAMEKIVAVTDDPTLRERLNRHLNQNQ